MSTTASDTGLIPECNGNIFTDLNSVVLSYPGSSASKLIELINGNIPKGRTEVYHIPPEWNENGQLSTVITALDTHFESGLVIFTVYERADGTEWKKHQNYMYLSNAPTRNHTNTMKRGNRGRRQSRGGGFSTGPLPIPRSNPGRPASHLATLFDLIEKSKESEELPSQAWASTANDVVLDKTVVAMANSLMDALNSEVTRRRRKRSWKGWPSASTVEGANTGHLPHETALSGSQGWKPAGTSNWVDGSQATWWRK